MIRQIVLATTVATALAVGVIAAERATFVLTDGSRQSGDIVFHGSGNRNIIDNFLNLGQGGHEQTFPMDRVAIIDFAGDQPNVSEFQQLPAEQGNLLVLRGGGAQRGRLVNMINGDTVQWENEGGQAQQYAIRDVVRIYLSPAAARRIYPQFASATPPPAPAAPAPRAAADAPLPSGAVRVPANQQWVSSGVLVRKGQRLAFGVTGQIQFSANAAHASGPDGNAGVQTANLPVATMPVGGLIGRIGGSPPFAIGSSRQPIVMNDSGPLLLGVNDTDVSDNSGSFAVSVARIR